ncbi:general secretion pathway protein L [Alcanivorax hongdengensis A-11-3]|uniref:Type II secretion system protein L n=2 Tax=Alcanivorax hongdengensis TaxID=519051 RepID=L0W9Z9_9GAMM|nr:general secretion pathway protein L [Alcanivorax hongdengensis A-11-3]
MPHADMPVYWRQGGADVQSGSLAQALQACNGPVRLVLSNRDAQLTEVSLSRKQARHLQKVLPFLLEEQLLDSPESLWLAAGKAESGHYPVAAIAREHMDAWVALVADSPCTLQSIRVDTDLLADRAPLIISLDGKVLLQSGRNQALWIDQADQDRIQPLFAGALDEAMLISAEDELFDLFAAAFREGRAVELMQGAYAPRKDKQASSSMWAPWRPIMAMAAVIFVCAVITLWVQEWRYQRAADAAFAQAQARYEQLFPGDRATAALSRQFRARLARLGGVETADAGFLSLLAPVATVLHGSKVEAKRMQFDQRDGSLMLDVGAKDYAELEKLQQAIRKQGVDANIANYRNGASGVNARIKVEQAG